MGESTFVGFQLSQLKKDWTDKIGDIPAPAIEDPPSPAQPLAGQLSPPQRSNLSSPVVSSTSPPNHCHSLEPALDGGEVPPPSQPVHSQQSQQHYFHWTAHGLDNLSCPICQDLHLSLAELEIHYHQYHVNPRFLSQADVKLFRLSNFLVKDLEDSDCEGRFPGLYRCHECFNTFSNSSNLKDHLVKHLPAIQMAPKTEHSSSPEIVNMIEKKKRSVHNKSQVTEVFPMDKSCEGERISTRPRRTASLKRITEMESELSDEFNSNSENEGDASNRRKGRPQRQCKSRTKTLVAISIAEQEYDKFDLGKHFNCYRR